MLNCCAPQLPRDTDGWVAEKEAVRLLREQHLLCIREDDIQKIFAMQAWRGAQQIAGRLGAGG